MALLDQIIEMKRRGMPSSQIMQNLREQGISPKEINEVLSQSEIKAEIDFQKFPQYQQPQLGQSMQSLQSTQPFQNPIEEMQPSLGTQPPMASEQLTQDQNQEQFQQPEQGYQSQEYQEYTPAQAYPGYQPYQEYQYQEYQPPQATDIETINDIASQLIEEKTKSLKKELENAIKFKSNSEEKIKEIDKRLTKIESTLEELQLAIIRKIGSYGEDIKNISKEMRATQETFSKIIDPLTDNIKELQKITGLPTAEHSESSNHDETGVHSAGKTKEKESRLKRSKKSPSFEDYLR